MKQRLPARAWDGYGTPNPGHGPSPLVCGGGPLWRRALTPHTCNKLPTFMPMTFVPRTRADLGLGTPQPPPRLTVQQQQHLQAFRQRRCPVPPIEYTPALSTCRKTCPCAVPCPCPCTPMDTHRAHKSTRATTAAAWCEQPEPCQTARAERGGRDPGRNAHQAAPWAGMRASPCRPRRLLPRSVSPSRT